MCQLISNQQSSLNENIFLNRFVAIPSKTALNSKHTWRGKNNTVFVRNQTVPDGIFGQEKRQSLQNFSPRIENFRESNTIEFSILSRPNDDVGSK